MHLKAKITELLQEIEQVNDLFYQQKEQQGYERYVFLISRISAVIDEIFAYKAEHSEFYLDELKLTQTLQEAMVALEKKDTVLLADILQYDFMEQLKEMEQLL